MSNNSINDSKLKLATKSKTLGEMIKYPVIVVRSRELTLLALIFILGLAMSIAYPNNFLSTYNFSAILLNLAPSAILVTGMMILMIGGGFDLSIGSVLALSGVASAAAFSWWGWPAQFSIGFGIAVGAFAGTINGLIVTQLRINPLIATLATMAIFRGATQLATGTGIMSIGDEFKAFGQTVFFGLQSPIWVAALIVCVFWWAVAKTRFFRQFYFIGGNERAAQLSGIRVARMTLIGFVIMGALAGLAGTLIAARLNTAVVTAGIGVELTIVTAAVLGGASLRGGEGSVIGGVLGVVLIALVQNALIINGVGVFWQSIIIGLVLLSAVSLDRFTRNEKA
jgi:ribose transport system permease protein